MNARATALLTSFLFAGAAWADDQEDDRYNRRARELQPEKADRKESAQDSDSDSDGNDDRDGMRVRWGIAATAGLESVSSGPQTASGAMFGGEARLGLQLNNLLGVYAQTDLSGGTLSANGGSGATGTISVAGMAEITLLNRLFLGAGFGYGILNNPSGPMFEARGGVYPLMGKGDNGIRRHGLMLGVDLRTIFVNGATGLLVTGTLGYEAF